MVYQLANIADRIFALPPLYLVLWALLAALTVALVLLMRTAWGRERPTPRYVLLSIIAHLGLICLATTVRFMSAPEGEPAASPIKVRIVMRTPAPSLETPVEKPAPQEATIQPAEPTPLVEPPPEPAPTEPPVIDSPQAEPVVEPIEAPPLMPPPTPAETPAEPTPLDSSPELANKAPQPSPQLASQPKEALAEPAPRQQVSSTLPPVEPLTPLPPVTPIESVTVEQPPSPYAPREHAERLKIVEHEGGSRATEDAVAAALAWLASAQSRDGRWDADRWSAGRETHALGHDRQGAGARADTGITGLALLAMLGAGNTLDDGPYADSVHGGVAFLLRSQTRDGGLAGNAATYAQTYCHSMATFALAEAYATTDDPQLGRAVQAAVDFLIARQDRSGGGWRYRPGDAGDMSQMGWIIMALRSAELAHVDVPPTVWSSIERFVRSTRRGAAGGLACYQPRGATSRTMTAESFYCRQILGWPTAASPASNEAIQHILGSLPGQGRANYYYWYYASLALHHHRTSDRLAEQAWRAWNDAMSRTLVGTQVSGGPNAGSWSPNSLWGGYGGRVYTTAMAAMCLEVYYRYDAGEVARDPWVAARPGGRLR